MGKVKSFKPSLAHSAGSGLAGRVGGWFGNKRQIEQKIPFEGGRVPFAKKGDEWREVSVAGNNPHEVVKVISLGGVGNVQRNMYCYEYKGDLVIIDCGVGFPEEEMPGVDLVIPDISYLRDKKDKIRGIVLSHGHDDHIGGLPFIWPELQVPIYTQKLTAGFVRSKFIEHKLPTDKINVVGINDKIKLGVFDISFYAITHSVPDTTGIVMRTPVGILVHQADFKIDWTPVYGLAPEVGKIAQIGSEGVLYMTIDCLGAEREGYTLSEQAIGEEFKDVEAKTAGKVMITTTSSNITRLQQALDMASETGRKVVLAGRSIEGNFQVARDLGYLSVPPGLLVAQEAARRFADNKLVVLIAGSQGQPGSALSRVANFDHKYIIAKKGDSVVFSADPIPGSEANQYKLIDSLTLIGCKVYYSALDEALHVSGHASQEEMKLLVNLVKPKFIMPIGGTHKNTAAFRELAMSLGYKDKDIIVPQRDGEVIELGKGFYGFDGKINISNVYVDGLGVGDVGSIVLRDRQVMSEEGVVMVIIPISKSRDQIVGKIEIVSRGFVFEKQAEELLEKALKITKTIVEEHVRPGVQTWDWKYLRSQIENNLDKFFYQETNRRPLILPMIVNF